MKKSLFAFLFALFSSVGFSQTPCVDGFAGIYPCNDVDLFSIVPMSVLNNSIGLNDIWGWTDPLDGKEYALVGMREGTAFVDVTDPLDPLTLGFLATHTDNSTWRDIKVFSDHAFIVSEASGHGMQVFDLTRLRNLDPADLPITFDADAHYNGFGNCHNIAINEETGYAYAIGTGTFFGGPHFIDINDPVNPAPAGGFEDEGYTHDAQIVIYHGPDEEHQCKEIAFCNNGNNGAPFVIVDVTEKAEPELISASFYDSLGYSHQGWLTDDHRFFLHNDETDEIGFGFNTRTHMWDVADLDAPIYMGYFESTSSASDHNHYTRGDYLFQSNYRAGLRILDMTDLENGNLEEVAYFDLFPESDDVNTGGGTWSNYPYFASGNIIVTHRQFGLFTVRPKDSAINNSYDEDFSATCPPLVDDLVENELSSVSIFPNPSNDLVKIESELLNEIGRLSLMNMYGQEVLELKLTSTNDTQVQIDISTLENGFYMLYLDGRPAGQSPILKN